MSSPMSATKKKPPKKTTTTPENTRKEVRTDTGTQPVISPQLKVVRTVVAPKQKLVRTTRLKDPSEVAREAVEKLKTQQAAKPPLEIKKITPVRVPRKAAQPVPASGPLVPVRMKPTKSLQPPPKPVKSLQPPGKTASKTAEKTKRGGFVTNTPVLRGINAQYDDKELRRVYDEYYKSNGRRRPGTAATYNTLVDDSPAYVQTPVTSGQFAEFTRANPMIEAQLMWQEEYVTYREDLAQYQKDMGKYDAKMKTYRRDMDAWLKSSDTDSADMPTKPRPPFAPIPPPKSLEEAVQRGDYFHVHNTSTRRPASQDTVRRARRVVVNVKTQEAALKVAKGLTGLFDDRTVAPHLDHYKIYLSQDTDDPGTKRDKLVIYYEVPPDATEDLDVVGDRIAATIDASVTKDETSDDFAPFYARLGRGVAWAEEPAAFVEHLDDSFTGTRATIIDTVLDNPRNRRIEDPAEFIRLVREEFRKNHIDPDNPHRHLGGEEPEAYTRVRRQAPPKPPVAVRLTATKRLGPALNAKPVATGPGSVKPPAKIAARIPAKPLPPVPAPRIQRNGGPVPLTRRNTW